MKYRAKKASGVMQLVLLAIVLAVLAAAAVSAVRQSCPSSHTYLVPALSTVPETTKSLRSGLNINTATKKELMELPGIGDVIAQAIIDSRKKDGMFRYLEDLLTVEGIGAKILDDIRSLVYVP